MTDFVSLAAVGRASDFRNETLSAPNLEWLANMLGHLIDRPGLVEAVPEGAAGIDRVRAVVKHAKHATTSREAAGR